MGRSFDDEGLMKAVDGVIERYSAAKYDISRCDLGGNWSGTAISNLDKILQSIKGHMIGDDDGHRMEDAIQRIRKMFVRRAATWFVTNRPSKEEVEEAVEEKAKVVDGVEDEDEEERSNT